MANSQKSSTLVDQTISKLLEFQAVKIPKDSALLDLLHPTTQRSPYYANTNAKAAGQAARQRMEQQKKNRTMAEQAIKNTKGKILVIIAWIILVLNILTVAGNLEFGLKLPLSLHAIENTNGFLFQTAMLAFGAFILTWITWLYSKNKVNGSISVPLLIIIALLIIYTSFIKESGNGMTNMRELGRTILCSFPSTTTPMYRLVSAILYSEDKPSAVIGNKIVYEGGKIRGINIVKIYEDKVEFEKNGKRWMQSIENRPLTY